MSTVSETNRRDLLRLGGAAAGVALTPSIVNAALAGGDMIVALWRERNRGQDARRGLYATSEATNDPAEEERLTLLDDACFDRIDACERAISALEPSSEEGWRIQACLMAVYCLDQSCVSQDVAGRIAARFMRRFDPHGAWQHADDLAKYPEIEIGRPA